MNRYGIRGTFHLNSGRLGNAEPRQRIAREEVKELYQNHLTAQRNLVVSVDNRLVYNPSGIRVWFMVDGKEYSIGAGEMLTLN